MSDGPGPGAILLGIFLILCGLCVTLLGGGCTVLLLAEVGDLFRYGGFFFLILSLLVLAAGIATIWLGVKIFRGPPRDWD